MLSPDPPTSAILEGEPDILSKKYEGEFYVSDRYSVKNNQMARTEQLKYCAVLMNVALVRVAQFTKCSRRSAAVSSVHTFKRNDDFKTPD